MNEEAIKKILNTIESWVMMSCEGCAMQEKITPLLADIRRLLETESIPDQAPKSLQHYPGNRE